MGTRGLLYFIYKNNYYCFYIPCDAYISYMGELIVLFINYTGKEELKNRIENISCIFSNKLEYLNQYNKDVIAKYNNVIKELDCNNKPVNMTFEDIFLEKKNMFRHILTKTCEFFIKEEIITFKKPQELNIFIKGCDFEYIYKIDLDNSIFNLFKVIRITKKYDKNINDSIFLNRKNIRLQKYFESNIENLIKNWKKLNN